MSGPAYHGRTHGFKLNDERKIVGVGTDPIAFPDLVFPTSGGGLTFPDATLAAPTVWSAWPMDDAGTSGQLVGPPGPASGSAVDVVGGRDLSIHLGTDNANVVVEFETAGPFVNEPDWNAIRLVGQQHATDFTARLERALSSAEVAEVFTGTHPFTIEMFWNRDGLLTFQMNLLVLGTGEPGTVQISHRSDEKLQFYRAGTSVTSTSTLPIFEWGYLTFVYDGTDILIYQNGVLDGTATGSGSIASGGHTLYIGSDASSVNFNPSQGRYSWVVIHDGALDAATISARAGLIGSSTNAAAGKVWTSQGDGTEAWEYPTIEVTY